MDRRLKEVGSRSYISTDEFNENFFDYVITSSPPTFVKTGSLVPVRGASTVKCPPGAVLRENGKKLYPEAHSGVKTFMVGVFDTISGLKGYINPNDPMFAPYNTERPIYLKDSVYTSDPTTKNLGPSVLTLGHIASSGDVTSPGQVTASGQVRSSSFTILEIVDGVGVGVPNSAELDVSQGQVFMINMTKNVTLIPTNMSTGAIVYLMITGGNSTYTLSFANGPDGSINGVGDFSIVSNKSYTIHFFCNSPVYMFELGRTSAFV